MGWSRGEPKRFINGHNAKGQRSHLVPAGYLDAERAAGPKVIAWLMEMGDYPRPFLSSDRQLRRWADGENPSIGALDRVLLREFDRYLWELPEDVWLARRQKVTA